MVYIARTLFRIGSTAFLVIMALAMLSSSIGVKASPTNQTPTPTQQPTRPILLTDPVPDPKQQGVLYFPATGHTLRGAFLEYWNRYGGLAQFGYPLTEEFFEPVGADNKLYQVQYFERNRFELHPENAGTPYEVLLGVLGRDFRQQDPPATPLANATYFRETGHNLSGKFKQYWDTHGGLFVHGYPITEPIQEKSPTDGKTYTVQWFERSRFELHPENAGSPYEVLLGLLGRQLSERKGYPKGAYPLYGRAADYSWISGLVELYNPSTQCESGDCGCVFLRHAMQGDAYKQLVSPNKVSSDEYYKPATLPGDPFNVYGSYFVVFGRKLLPTEKYSICADQATSPPPGYVRLLAQTNPAQ